VDHQRTRTWEVRRLAWMPWNADQDRLRDTVMLQAQQLVARAACSAENIQQAKIAAETILKTLYAEVGWEVQVTWEPKMAHVPTAAVPATMMSGNLVPAIELGAHRARVVPHEPTAFADGVPAKAKLSYQDRDRPGIRSPAITGDALRADSTCV
jgi:hypothetical protein